MILLCVAVVLFLSSRLFWRQLSPATMDLALAVSLILLAAATLQKILD